MMQHTLWENISSNEKQLQNLAASLLFKLEGTEFNKKRVTFKRELRTRYFAFQEIIYHGGFISTYIYNMA